MGAFSFNSSSSLENENSTFLSPESNKSKGHRRTMEGYDPVAFKDGVLLMRSRSIPFIVRQGAKLCPLVGQVIDFIPLDFHIP